LKNGKRCYGKDRNKRTSEKQRKRRQYIRTRITMNRIKNRKDQKEEILK
jgi:hypothetical protein